MQGFLQEGFGIILEERVSRTIMFGRLQTLLCPFSGLSLYELDALCHIMLFKGLRRLLKAIVFRYFPHEVWKVDAAFRDEIDGSIMRALWLGLLP